MKILYATSQEILNCDPMYVKRYLLRMSGQKKAVAAHAVTAKGTTTIPLQRKTIVKGKKQGVPPNL